MHLDAISCIQMQRVAPLQVFLNVSSCVMHRDALTILTAEPKEGKRKLEGRACQKLVRLDAPVLAPFLGATVESRDARAGHAEE